MGLQGARQAVNLVNGGIVDGLGHVSLESPSLLHQPNIHQGSIPATGRREKGGSVLQASSVPTSSATSLPFNQLIGGAISPSLLSSSGQPLMSHSSAQAYQVIGDYAMIGSGA